MSPKKALVLDCGDEGAKEALTTALSGGGVEILTDDGKDALLAADFLVLCATDAEKLNEKETEEKWEFFLDEIKWKRKDGGEVIIIDCSEISFSPSRLAYALKKCKRFRSSQAAEVVGYVTAQRDEKSAVSASKTTALKAAVSVPEKPTPPVKKKSGACRDDHVFGSDAGSKSYVRDLDGKKCESDHVFEKDNADEPDDFDIDEPDDFDTDEFLSEDEEGKNPTELFGEYPDIKDEKRKPIAVTRLSTVAVLVVVAVIAIMFFQICSSVGLFACSFFGESVLPEPSIAQVLPPYMRLSVFDLLRL